MEVSGRCQLRYWQRPLDAYSLLIRARFPVHGEKPQILLQQRRQSKLGSHSLGQDFQTVDIKIGRQGVFWPACDLSSTLVCTPHHEEAVVPVSRVLEHLGADPEVDIPAILLVEPLVELVFKDAWNTLLYLARWDRLWWSAWPPPTWVHEVCSQHISLSEAPQMRVQDVRALASDLRRWAPRIVDDVSGRPPAFHHTSLVTPHSLLVRNCFRTLFSLQVSEENFSSGNGTACITVQFLRKLRES